MTQTYIPSDSIRVFPTSGRSDKYDRNARLNTETNITSLVNRLSGDQNFVINGLTVSGSSGNWTIAPGACNIRGYYFNISQAKSEIGNGDAANNKYLVLKISLNTFNVNTIDDSQDISYLDNSIDTIDGYTGLQIITTNTIDDNSLKLAEWDNTNSVWVDYNDSRIISESPIIIDDGQI